MPKATHTTQHLARVNACMEAIRRHCQLGAKKADIGRFIRGPHAKDATRQANTSIVTNFLGGRIPSPESLALLEKWVRAREKAMKKAID